MKKVIEVKKIIHDKNPKLCKWVPSNLLAYLRKILHEDEINEILHEMKDKKNFEFCEELVTRFNLSFSATGLEKIPKEGGVILVANHPLGGFDALALVYVISSIRSDLKFMVNDVLLNFNHIENYMVGVNKHGANSKTAVHRVNELFASDQAVFIFPAGLVSRKTKRVVEDSEWKKTFITKAKEHKRDVIPIHISGELSSFFYRLSNFRKRIGIKLNVEMVYLANETFKLKNKSFHITVGRPISWSTFDKSKPDQEWASEVKKVVYSLKN
ncbi:MAG: 1-acyl-sn-glycerol-3-phosphate acyltransferase [Crocinitomicaceae bacterium]|nr:1-acyl-sn-glycerol-3-phosphate acyltransferase [Crocinitomicaceae bacterium]